MKKLLKWGILILIVLGVVGALGNGNKNIEKPNSSSKKITSVPKAKEEIIKVKIGPFIREFDKNQLAAEKKYKDKTIEVTAYINNISEDILGTPFLTLSPKPSNYFGTTVHCNFSNKDALTSLKNGELATVRGKFKTQELGLIILDKCEIVK